MGLNIRVVKLSEEMVKRGQMSSDKSVLITEGYEGGIDNCNKKVVINFCPFCGTGLDYVKMDDTYVQEEVDY